MEKSDQETNKTKKEGGIKLFGYRFTGEKSEKCRDCSYYGEKKYLFSLILDIALIIFIIGAVISGRYIQNEIRIIETCEGIPTNETLMYELGFVKTNETFTTGKMESTNITTGKQNEIRE